MFLLVKLLFFSFLIAYLILLLYHLLVNKRLSNFISSASDRKRTKKLNNYTIQHIVRLSTLSKKVSDRRDCEIFFTEVPQVGTLH